MPLSSKKEVPLDEAPNIVEELKKLEFPDTMIEEITQCVEGLTVQRIVKSAFSDVMITDNGDIPVFCNETYFEYDNNDSLHICVDACGHITYYRDAEANKMTTWDSKTGKHEL